MRVVLILLALILAGCSSPPGQPQPQPQQPASTADPIESLTRRPPTRTPSARTPTPAPKTSTPAPATGTPVPAVSSVTTTSVPVPVTSTLVVTSIPSATIAPVTVTAVPTAVPMAGQPCPSWVHDSYKVAGPDGLTYATWHPPTDTTWGCNFGHEHGADPRGSPALLAGETVPFGYAAAKAGLAENHAGYKVARWDNVDHPNCNPDCLGARLLIVFHQGTTGAGRMTVPDHSSQVDFIQPADGRELHSKMMAPLGIFEVGCGADDPTPDLQVQQKNDPGNRLVQTSSTRCAEGVTALFPYEVWETALYVGTGGVTDCYDCGQKAYFSFAMAVFDPSTTCTAVSTTACTSISYSDDVRATGQLPTSTSAQFKGSKRETYLNNQWFSNAGNPTTVWTTPYGVQTDPSTPGAIQQFICAINYNTPANSAVFGTINYDDGTVHAPN